MMISRFSKQTPGLLLASTVAFPSKYDKIAIGMDFDERERENAFLTFNQERSTTSARSTVNNTINYDDVMFSKQAPGSLLTSTVALTSKHAEIAIEMEFEETKR